MNNRIFDICKKENDYNGSTLITFVKINANQKQQTHQHRIISFSNNPIVTFLFGRYVHQNLTIEIGLMNLYGENESRVGLCLTLDGKKYYSHGMYYSEKEIILPLNADNSKRVTFQGVLPPDFWQWLTDVEQEITW